MENHSTLEHHEPFIAASQYPTPIPSTTTDSAKHVTAYADNDHLFQKQAVSPDLQPVSADSQYLFQKQVIDRNSQTVSADSQHLSQKQVVPGGYEEPGHQPTFQWAHAEFDEGKAQGKTILGLRRNSFIIAACLLSVVIIAVVLGSVLGTYFAAQNSEQQKPPPIVKILEKSRLSASNFTSYEPLDHRLVYFQDEYENLICRHWKTDSNKWATVNITGSALAPYKPSRGSAIASATRQLDTGDPSVLTYAFFLDNETMIRGYMNENAEKDDSEFKSSALQGWNQKALDQSELSASYQYMDNYTGDPWAHIILAYQDPSGPIYVSNDSDFTDTSLAVPADKLSNDGPSALALGPFWGLGAGAMQLDWQTPGAGAGVKLSGFTLNKPSWINYNPEALSFHRLSSTASTSDQHLAFCRDTDMTRALLFLRNTDGTIALNYYDGEGHPERPLQFTGGSEANPRWGSIAATHGGYFYGITDGKILEYQISPDDPGTFIFNSQVYPD